jgi:hypothetical protein
MIESLPVILLGAALGVCILIGLATAGQHARKLEAMRLEVQVLRGQLEHDRSATVRAVASLSDAVDKLAHVSGETAQAVHDLQAHDVLRN